MKLIKKTNGRTVLSMNREEWVQLGKDNGWKVAQVPPQAEGGLPPVSANPAEPTPTGAPVKPELGDEDFEVLDPVELKKMFQQARSKLIQLFAPILKELGVQLDNQSQWEGLFKGLVAINQSTNLQLDVEQYRKLSRIMRAKQIV